MSLDIALIQDGEEIISMNWLRNPFGLCQWAEDNTKDCKDNLPIGLYYVCNHWAYDNGKNIIRPLFKFVVDQYWNEINKLDRGFFCFDLPSYRQFVEPHTSIFPSNWFMQSRYIYNGIKLEIPMDLFDKHVFNLVDNSLVYYKSRFKELVEFAELLQDTKYEFYCSN